MVVEDKRHMDIFWQMTAEIENHAVEYNRRMSGVTDKKTLIAERSRYNKELIALIDKHDRAMRFMAGQPVQPETHFGEGVLIAVGGRG